MEKVLVQFSLVHDNDSNCIRLEYGSDRRLGSINKSWPLSSRRGTLSAAQTLDLQAWISNALGFALWPFNSLVLAGDDEHEQGETVE